MHIPAVSRAKIAQWRQRWGASGDQRVVLFAGQLRPDKRPDILIRAAAVLPPSDWKLAVVGEDKGSERRMRALAAELGLAVSWHTGYVPAPEFVAALAAADVVGCPYDIASQSAILAMARQLGVPSVARDVGGLAELATIAMRSDDPAAIANACREAVERGRAGGDNWHSDALRAHLQAYRGPN